MSNLPKLLDVSPLLAEYAVTQTKVGMPICEDCLYQTDMHTKNYTIVGNSNVPLIWENYKNAKEKLVDVSCKKVGTSGDRFGR